MNIKVLKWILLEVFFLIKNIIFFIKIHIVNKNKKDGTDFGASLQQMIDHILKKFPEDDFVVIFMSDGEADYP